MQSGCKEKILTKKGEDIKKKCQVEKEEKIKNLNCQKWRKKWSKKWKKEEADKKIIN